MHRVSLILAGVLALVAAPSAVAVTAETADAALRAAAARPRVQAAPRPRSDFLLRSRLRSVTLAPNGRHVAWLLDDGRTRSVWLLPADAAAPTRLLPATDADRLLWTRDGHLLLVAERTLFVLSTDGAGRLMTPLGGSDERSLLAVDPVHPAAVLVVERSPAAAAAPRGWRLLRVDGQGRRTVLHEDAQQVTDAAFAADGTLAYLQRVEGERLAILHAEGRAWREVMRCEPLQRCTLLPRVGADGTLWIRGDPGIDRVGLIALSPDGTRRLIHEDPLGEADLDALSLDPDDGRPLIASYRSAAPADYAVASAVEAPLAALHDRLPQRELAVTIGSALWLVGERASTLPDTRWHLYDPASGALRRILDEAPRPARGGGGAAAAQWPAEDTLAAKIPIDWIASDGLRLHGFLTLPAGIDAARAPLLVHPHGGPWSRSRPDYSGFVQFLADRGYAVFEPNFRGSTGYGRGYLLAARGDFGDGRVQQDVVEGTRALLARGIGDPARVGIVGASFGGYTALLGVTGAPDLFRVAIAGVPPPDFGWTLRWTARSREVHALAHFIGFEAWLRQVDLDLADEALLQRLSDQSPLANAARLTRPVLLFAGGEDRRVALRGVVEYAARLKQLGKDVALYVDPDAGHALEDPVAREAWLYLVEEMLHRHLDGPAPAPPDAEVARYLARSARIGMGGAP
ncbi:MAG TPA: prolyl oligopeptidase family serine peptidase [Dokdonella sp.]|uniref:alpha/beta hydrolase family protein n=1 Tax=Dokdonella sp. TaxID=2291710 RepID=UPI002BE2DBB0|nr:prolyl oligopeptidase family serine peptidase [Dokdonella sp.]HUD42540.1 prolyl oligopeptidase family serine peptidase [Dokdonella sp.]